MNYPTKKQISNRAYELYVQRDCQPGHAMDDWLQAEYELMQLPVRKLAELEPPGDEKGGARKKTLIAIVRVAMLWGIEGVSHLKDNTMGWGG